MPDGARLKRALTSISTRDRLIVGALIVLGVGLPVVLGAISGSITIPHNDDYNYRRVALGLYQDGRIELSHFSVASLLGQLVAVQPFLWITGGGPWAFAIMTIGFTIVAIVAGYALVRRILEPGRALVAMLTFILFPGFLLNATTYMTDVPELSAAVLCLALGAAAIGPAGRTRWGWLAASLAVGCFAFSIREVALAAPVAVLIAVAAADRGSLRPHLVAAAVAIVAIVAIHLLIANLPDPGFVPFNIRGGQRRIELAFSTLALVLLPATALAVGWWRERWRRLDILAGLVVGYLVAWGALTTLARTGHLPEMLVGNLFGPYGDSGGGSLAGDRPTIYPSQAWVAVNGLALAAAIVLPAVGAGIVGTAIRAGGIARARVRGWLGSATGIVLLFATFTGLGLAAYGYAFTMFDRYLWPLAFAVATLLLIRPRSVGSRPAADASILSEASAAPESGALRTETPRRAVRPSAMLAAALLSGLAVLSMLELLNSDAFSAARWQMGLEATAAGIPAGNVDAGLEWVGYRSTGDAQFGRRPLFGGMYYTGWWSSFRLCGLVSSSPRNRTGYELITANPSAYRQFELFGDALPLYLYRVSGQGCP